jgi:hypothetical protein
VLGDRLEVMINKKKRLKYLILKHPVLSPKIHVLILEFFLPLPIER